MKYIFGALFTFITLTGCTSEISNECPLFDNVILNFRYPDEAGKDIFRDNIDVVDVLIFTEEGYYYDWKTISKPSLEEFQGTVLAVDPGEYLVVCWGNAASGAFSSGETALQNYCLVNTGKDEGYRVHYAPRKAYNASPSDQYSIYTISAPERGMLEQTYDFMPAYWRIDVYVSGYEDTSGSGALPQVQITDMLEGYDFLLSPLETHVNYELGTQPMNTSEGEWAHAGFYTAYFTPADEIRINVCNKTDGVTVGTVFLNDFIRENGRELSYGKVEVIEVLISFTEYGVTVSVPDWDTIKVVPDL